MAELCGKATGTSGGMGGSMHIFSKEKRFYGGHGIVGGQIPLGAGIAFADKYFETGGVNICFFGDGAARQGSLHETFNMAMNWKLPVVFVVENNQYAMGTSVKRTANHEDIYKLGLGYEMPCLPVDAMDPEKVAEAAYEAIGAIRQLSSSIGIPSGLAELNVKEEDLAVMAENAQKDACMLTNPRKANHAQVVDIFKNAM